MSLPDRNSERAATIAWLLDLAERASPEAAEALREAVRDLRAGRHRPSGGGPRQVSTLPESEQAEALARVETITRRHRASGTEPTPIPKGAQRT